MTLNIYEIILLVLFVLNLGIALSQHGKIETRKNNFMTSFIGFVIIMFLLYMAGLFR